MAKEINIIMIKDNLSNIEVLKLIKSSIDTERNGLKNEEKD